MTMYGDKIALRRVGIIMFFLMFKTGFSNRGFAIKAVLVTQATCIIEIYTCFVLFLLVILVQYSFFCMLMFIVFFIPVELPA